MIEEPQQPEGEAPPSGDETPEGVRASLARPRRRTCPRSRASPRREGSSPAEVAGEPATGGFLSPGRRRGARVPRSRASRSSARLPREPRLPRRTPLRRTPPSSRASAAAASARARMARRARTWSDTPSRPTSSPDLVLEEQRQEERYRGIRPRPRLVAIRALALAAAALARLLGGVRRSGVRRGSLGSLGSLAELLEALDLGTGRLVVGRGRGILHRRLARDLGRGILRRRGSPATSSPTAWPRQAWPRDPLGGLALSGGVALGLLTALPSSSVNLHGLRLLRRMRMIRPRVDLELRSCSRPASFAAASL